MDPGWPDGPEVELPRGDVTEGVVRVGATVRRPAQPQSASVFDYLRHLERAGFDGAPRALGRDGRGRDVLSFVAGDVPGDPPERWAADEDLLASVGALLRRLHDASAGYAAGRGLAGVPGSPWQQLPTAPGAPADLPVEAPPELVAHRDVTPQNVVVRGGAAVAVVDFDMAGPTTRRADVVNTAFHWVPLRDPADVWPAWRGVDAGRRLRLLADGCGLGAADRAALVDEGVARSARSWWRMRGAAQAWGGGWARMWDAGVGDLIERRRTWLLRSREELTAALLDGVS